MRLLIRSQLIIFTLLIGTLPGFAQPGDPASDPDQVPIQGIGYLIVAGILLGAKKISSWSKGNK
jgi:hypothetical protein